jgi:hypothetical protein
MLHLDLSTADKMQSAEAAIESAAAKRLTESYAAMLMRLYPERVLRFLEAFSDEQLANTAGLATDEEMNANYMNLMLRETAEHGCD